MVPENVNVGQRAWRKLPGMPTGDKCGFIELIRDALVLYLAEKIQRQWGQYSPYFPAGKYIPPPSSCSITQVNILQRHGARYPNGDDDYDVAVKHLLAADEFRDSNLYFLRDYEYQLKQDVLIPFGAEQSFEAGEIAYRRYGHLVSEHNLPFIRAASKPRVVSTAGNWTVGFAAASTHHYNPSVNVIISEEKNNTLNNDCPNADDGTKEKNQWLDVFAPSIVKRLKHAAKGAKIKTEDIHRLLALCPFETIAFEQPSPFCGLFTDEEFNAMEYYGDVEKYYKTGYGNSLGPVQGVGYVNELISRLTGRPVQDSTQHDPSLSFPLGRTLYADFTHENLMVAVFSAMGLFNFSEGLNPKKMDENRGWVASRMVPFSARMVVERLACYGSGTEDEDEEGEEEEYVRVLVNDELQPMEFCGAGKDGLCTLDGFVQSQEYARRSGNGDFEKCYN
ncbi:hypothetical protein EW026_g4210 [Hermanssonia centrifuga]|uniref:Phytase A n=1 Tax=Hermanssonia centrifuga TaxID=98765 RepID=A0A4S4KI72_9APHY|nr:hypothetical protein EW026_g4210 [Hermanssonia centrifuga]